jgi:hypothetical protein
VLVAHRYDFRPGVGHGTAKGARRNGELADPMLDCHMLGEANP